MNLPPEDVARVVALIEAGHSQRDAARQTGIPRTTIQYVYQRYRETGEYSRRSGSGSQRRTTARDDRFVVLSVLRNRHQTAVGVRNELERVRGVSVSERTIRRRLQERGLQARRPATGPQLLPRHRRQRLQFAREHVNWTIAQWGNVLFSDESRFCLRGADGRERVWRRSGERYAECTRSETVPFQGGSVMVWGGVSLDGRTELVFVGGGSLTSERYVEEILLEHVLPYSGFVGEDFIFSINSYSP